MARKFETTAIASTVKAPISKRSLTHINTAFDELGEDLVKALIGTYTTNDVIILYGCVVTANIPGTSEVTAGAIFYNGRIYKVDANASISTPSNTLVWSIIETTISGDPATFSDGSSEDFHIIEKFRLTNAATGTGIADYNGATVKNLSGIYSGSTVFSSLPAQSDNGVFDGTMFISAHKVGKKVTATGILSLTVVDDATFNATLDEDYTFPMSTLFDFSTAQIALGYVGSGSGMNNNTPYQTMISAMRITGGDLEFQIRGNANVTNTQQFSINFTAAWETI